MDEIWRNELGDEGGHDIGEEDDAFGNIWADEVEGGGENYHVEDVVDEACSRQPCVSHNVAEFGDERRTAR